MYAAVSGLRIVAVLEVQGGHAVQPCLPQLREVGIGLGQTVMEVYQLLRVVLVHLEGREGRREGGEGREGRREGGEEGGEGREGGREGGRGGRGGGNGSLSMEYNYRL